MRAAIHAYEQTYGKSQSNPRGRARRGRILAVLRQTLICSARVPIPSSRPPCSRGLLVRLRPVVRTARREGEKTNERGQHVPFSSFSCDGSLDRPVRPFVTTERHSELPLLLFRFDPKRKLLPAKVASQLDGLLGAVLKSSILKLGGSIRPTGRWGYVLEGEISGQDVGVPDGAVAFGAGERLFGGSIPTSGSARIFHRGAICSLFGAVERRCTSAVSKWSLCATCC